MDGLRSGGYRHQGARVPRRQVGEVIECHSQRRFDRVYDYPNRKMRQRDEKRALNRFLSEFLSLCLVHGEVTGVPAVMGS